MPCRQLRIDTNPTVTSAYKLTNTDTEHMQPNGIATCTIVAAPGAPLVCAAARYVLDQVSNPDFLENDSWQHLFLYHAILVEHRPAPTLFTMWLTLRFEPLVPTSKQAWSNDFGLFSVWCAKSKFRLGLEKICDPQGLQVRGTGLLIGVVCLGEIR